MVTTTRTQTTKKPATKKPAAKKTSTATSENVAPAKNVQEKKVQEVQAAKVVSPQEYYHMVAQAAYFLAEKRGFTPGGEHYDWEEAERQIQAGLLD